MVHYFGRSIGTIIKLKGATTYPLSPNDAPGLKQEVDSKLDQLFNRIVLIEQISYTQYQ